MFYIWVYCFKKLHTQTKFIKTHNHISFTCKHILSFHLYLICYSYLQKNICNSMCRTASMLKVIITLLVKPFWLSQNSAQAHTPYLSSTPQMCTIQLSFKGIISRQVTNCSIGISPPQGTPPAAPLGYRSIIIPCIFYRPPSVVIRLHSKYRIIAPPKNGRFSRTFWTWLDCSSQINEGNVTDEWIFNFQ